MVAPIHFQDAISTMMAQGIYKIYYFNSKVKRKEMVEKKISNKLKLINVNEYKNNSSGQLE